jgi:hypothetical protein
MTRIVAVQSLLQMALSVFCQPYYWDPGIKNIVRRGLGPFVILVYAVPLLSITGGILLIISADERVIYLLLIVLTCIILGLVCHSLADGWIGGRSVVEFCTKFVKNRRNAGKGAEE